VLIAADGTERPIDEMARCLPVLNIDPAAVVLGAYQARGIFLGRLVLSARRETAQERAPVALILSNG
jgi:hypothetical protein